MDTPVPAARYAAHPKYRLWAAAWAAVAGVSAWQLRQGIDAGALLFLGIALALLVWYGREVGSTVTLEGRRLRLHRPLAADAVVEFRQLAAVHQEGRIGASILLHYHPLAADGLVALDNLRSLALPALVDQEELMGILQKEVRT